MRAYDIYEVCEHIGWCRSIDEWEEALENNGFTVIEIDAVSAIVCDDYDEDDEYEVVFYGTDTTIAVKEVKQS